MGLMPKAWEYTTVLHETVCVHKKGSGLGYLGPPLNCPDLDEIYCTDAIDTDHP